MEQYDDTFERDETQAVSIKEIEKHLRTLGCTKEQVRRHVDQVTRVQTHSNPERDDGGEDDGGQEVEGELVVACGNAPEVLEATEGCFDPPAITIAPFIVADGAFA
jgi:hypothetical protein